MAKAAWPHSRSGLSPAVTSNWPATSTPTPDSQHTEPTAEDSEVVLGVDTRKDLHVAAVISELGALLGACSFSATAWGYRQLLGWARGSASCAEPVWSTPAPTQRR